MTTVDALRLPNRLAARLPGKLGERADRPVVSLVRLHGVITAMSGPLPRSVINAAAVEKTLERAFAADGLAAENVGAECVISVEDDGVGMDPRRLREDMADAHLTGAHVGLGNVDDRMRSAFGDDFGLVVDTAPGAGTKITLRVPKFRAGIRA